MKKNIEITGEIAEVIESYVGIRLHICGDITDFFAVDTEEKEILTRLNATTKILLKIEHTYEDYVKLIADLGLEIPQNGGEESMIVYVVEETRESDWSWSCYNTEIVGIYETESEALEKIKQLREQDKNKYNDYAIETWDTLTGV